MTKNITEIEVYLEAGGDMEDLSISELETLKKYKLIKSINKFPEKEEPQEKGNLDSGGERKEEGNGTDLSAWANGYWKRHENLKSRSGYDNAWKPLDDIKFQVREGQKWGETGISKMFANTDSDTGCEDIVSAWSPEDVYSKVVWNTAVCKADLFKLCVKGIDINPGDGLKTQIRVFGAFGDPVPKASCQCGSCASIGFTTYPLTLIQYNLEAIVCAKDIWDVGDVLMDSYINAMSDSWAKFFDAQIYAQLETASPGTTEQLPASLNCTPSIGGSCCSDASLLNMYNAVNAVVSAMREGATPYNPDWMIISPSVAAIFKRMQTPKTQFNASDIKFDDSGRLSKIAGLNVIEYCGANSCCTDADEVVAIIIDSSRAVGAVFGQKPKLYKFFMSNCNSYRLDYWSFFATGELDVNAIAHITNAS